VNGTSLVIAPQAGAATGNVILTVSGTNGALTASIQIVVTVT
jgi:hypothetical protein